MSSMLARAGESLFGPNWSGPLREALNISDRTFRRMANGQQPVPAGVWSELAHLAAANARRNRALARELANLARATLADESLRERPAP